MVGLLINRTVNILKYEDRKFLYFQMSDMNGEDIARDLENAEKECENLVSLFTYFLSCVSI